MQNRSDKGSEGDKVKGKWKWLSLLAVILVVTLDQLSKFWIRANLPQGESLPESGFLRLTHVMNAGFVFGLPGNQVLLLIVPILTILFIIPFFFYYLPAHYHFSMTGLCYICAGLILGGAVGNLIDRLRLGYVTDFIDIRLWDNFHWPAFNFADSSIVVGACILIYAVIRAGLFKEIHDYSSEGEN